MSYITRLPNGNFKGQGCARDSLDPLEKISVFANERKFSEILAIFVRFLKKKQEKLQKFLTNENTDLPLEIPGLTLDLGMGPLYQYIFHKQTTREVALKERKF